MLCGSHHSPRDSECQCSDVVILICSFSKALAFCASNQNAHVLRVLIKSLFTSYLPYTSGDETQTTLDLYCIAWNISRGT
jgi:hypothetical protein